MTNNSWLAVIVLIVAAIAISNSASDQPISQIEQTLQCADEGDRETMRTLMHEAIEKGFKEHALNLYKVMVKDTADQPNRAMRGLRPAILAYTKSREAIDAWSPPPCTVK